MNLLYISCLVAVFTVPDIDTSFKSYMDYRAITDEDSMQYKLQQEAYTDNNGLRKVGDYYCVALGSYYGSEIGQCYLITLDTGDSFKAILADQKADSDTDENNQYTETDNGGNVVEFVVDVKKLPGAVRWQGTVSAIDGFNGSIESIEPIEYMEVCGR